MPPKRKRVDTETEAAPSARRSTRSKGKVNQDEGSQEIAASKPKKATTKKASTSKASTIPDPAPDKDEDGSAEHLPKKSKTTKAVKEKAATKPKASKGKAKTTAGADDDELANEDEVTTKKKVDDTHSVAQQQQQPYSHALALSLFDAYADPDTASSDDPAIGPEGFEKLCNDAQIPLEGALPLVLAWMLDSKEMAKIGKSEWVRGTSSLQISSLYALSTAVRDLESMLILNKPPIDRSQSTKKGTKESYNRDQYWSYAADKKNALLKLYLFCFALAKPEQARNIDIETATAFWSVLLTPQYPIMTDVIEFITEKGTYKGVNKDLWNMMLEFCQTVDSSLENYEADGAWPTLLDDFVAWKKAKETSNDDE